MVKYLIFNFAFFDANFVKINHTYKLQIFKNHRFFYIYCTEIKNYCNAKNCHNWPNNTEYYVLRPVSTTSVEKSILCLFYCFFFALASILTARFNRRSIKERKNALFHARSGNGPLNAN